MQGNAHPSPLVSIVMVSYYTGGEVLKQTIASVLAQTYLKELVIINNGNPEDVTAYLKHIRQQDPRITVIEPQKNVGFAQACNLGVEVASAPYILLLNPDTLLPTNCFEPLIEVLASKENCWMVGCVIRNSDGTLQQTCRRHILTPVNALVEGLGLTKLFRMDAVDIHGPLPEEAEPVPAISGAFMMLTKQRYLQLGGMDEHFFLHVEDLDFCYRIKEYEGEIWFVPYVEVVHHGKTSKALYERIEWHKLRSFMRYFRKHFKYQYFPGWLVFAYSGLIIRFFLRCGYYRLNQLSTCIISLLKKQKGKIYHDTNRSV